MADSFRSPPAVERLLSSENGVRIAFTGGCNGPSIFAILVTVFRAKRGALQATAINPRTNNVAYSIERPAEEVHFQAGRRRSMVPHHAASVPPREVTPVADVFASTEGEFR